MSTIAQSILRACYYNQKDIRAAIRAIATYDHESWHELPNGSKYELSDGSVIIIQNDGWYIGINGSQRDCICPSTDGKICNDSEDCGCACHIRPI
jgi:hypothetical protein